MASKGLNRKIFEYLDYREYLNDYFQLKKSTVPSFSLRTFSDRIGFKTKDFIMRVMRGDKNLSAQSIPMVASALGFGKHESAFFEALVGFNQAHTTDERNDFYGRMVASQKAARFTDKQLLLAHHQYQVFSDWRHLVIRSLIGMRGFDGNFDALAARVHPRIKAEEAKHSVEVLESCGLICQKTPGKYELSQSSITTGNRASKAALQGFHQSCLKLGAAAIDTTPASERNISGLTLGISPNSYARIVDRLNAFRKEIAQIADEDESADRVYQMNFLLFPLSGDV